jgi:hypothetical protein
MYGIVLAKIKGCAKCTIPFGLNFQKFRLSGESGIILRIP